MDCSASCVDTKNDCRPDVCRKGRPTDPLREEAVLGAHEDPRHDIILNESPGGWVVPSHHEGISKNEDPRDAFQGEPASPPALALVEAVRSKETRERMAIADVLRDLSDEPDRISGESPDASP